MSINPADLDKIDSQIGKVKKGGLTVAFKEDNGDQNPPNIDDSIGMMGEDNQNQQMGGGVDVATALKGFWKFVDMMLQMLCSRIDAIDYRNLNDAELTNISQQTAQVEAFQKLAVAENAPMWLSVANLVGTFGTKFSLNPEWQAKQKAKKEQEKQLEALKAKKLQEAHLVKKIQKIPEPQIPKAEPVYDSPPVDNSQPLEIVDNPHTDEEKFDDAERRLKDQLFAAGEIDEEQLNRLKVLKRAEAIKRKHNEDLAKKRAESNINGVGILES